jgi:hypothetical protein
MYRIYKCLQLYLVDFFLNVKDFLPVVLSCKNIIHVPKNPVLLFYALHHAFYVRHFAKYIHVTIRTDKKPDAILYRG